MRLSASGKRYSANTSVCYRYVTAIGRKYLFTRQIQARANFQNIFVSAVEQTSLCALFVAVVDAKSYRLSAKLAEFALDNAPFRDNRLSLFMNRRIPRIVVITTTHSSLDHGERRPRMTRV